MHEVSCLPEETECEFHGREGRVRAVLIPPKPPPSITTCGCFVVSPSLSSDTCTAI